MISLFNIVLFLVLSSLLIFFFLLFILFCTIDLTIVLYTCIEKPICNIIIIILICIIIFIMINGIFGLPLYLVALPYEICCILPESIILTRLMILLILIFIGTICTCLLLVLSPGIVIVLFSEVCIIVCIWSLAYILSCFTFIIIIWI